MVTTRQQTPRHQVSRGETAERGVGQLLLLLLLLLCIRGGLHLLTSGNILTHSRLNIKTFYRAILTVSTSWGKASGADAKHHASVFWWVGCSDEVGGPFFIG